MKEINSREELRALSHGTVVVLGPKSVVHFDEGVESGALAIQNIAGKWYTVGMVHSIDMDFIGSEHSWPALVVFEAS